MGPASAAGTSPVFPWLVQLSAVQPKKTKPHIMLLVTQWWIFIYFFFLSVSLALERLCCWFVA